MNETSLKVGLFKRWGQTQGGDFSQRDMFVDIVEVR